jgi:hypothetical protein
MEQAPLPRACFPGSEPAKACFSRELCGNSMPPAIGSAFPPEAHLREGGLEAFPPGVVAQGALVAGAAGAFVRGVYGMGKGGGELVEKGKFWYILACVSGALRAAGICGFRAFEGPLP